MNYQRTQDYPPIGLYLTDKEALALKAELYAALMHPDVDANGQLRVLYHLLEVATKEAV